MGLTRMNQKKSKIIGWCVNIVIALGMVCFAFRWDLYEEFNKEELAQRKAEMYQQIEGITVYQSDLPLSWVLEIWLHSDGKLYADHDFCSYGSDVEIKRYYESHLTDKGWHFVEQEEHYGNRDGRKTGDIFIFEKQKYVIKLYFSPPLGEIDMYVMPPPGPHYYLSLREMK